jgi:gluconolactonase
MSVRVPPGPTVGRVAAAGRPLGWRSAILLLFMMGSALARADVIASGLLFPEGTIFVGGDLYFVDYSTSDLLRLNGGTVRKLSHLDGCGANGLLHLDGSLLVACFDSGTILRVSLDGKVLDRIEQDAAGGTFNAPNDLTADGKGGVYFTASGTPGALGKVYHISAQGAVAPVADGIDFANGLALSPDRRTLYICETRTGRILAFTIAEEGRLSQRRAFVTLGHILRSDRGAYSPDGLRTDSAGRLYIALYNGGGIAIVGPDAQLIRQIDLPGRHHSNLALTEDGRFIDVTAIDDEPDGSYRGRILRLRNPLTE